MSASGDDFVERGAGWNLALGIIAIVENGDGHAFEEFFRVVEAHTLAGFALKILEFVFDGR